MSRSRCTSLITTPIAICLLAATACKERGEIRELDASALRVEREAHVERAELRLLKLRDEQLQLLQIRDTIYAGENGNPTVATLSDSLLLLADPTVCGVRIVVRATRRESARLGGCSSESLELHYVTNLAFSGDTITLADAWRKELLALTLDGNVIARQSLDSASIGAASLAAALPLSGRRIGVGLATYSNRMPLESGRVDTQFFVRDVATGSVLPGSVLTPLIGRNNPGRVVNNVQACQLGNTSSRGVVIATLWSHSGVVLAPDGQTVRGKFRTTHELDVVRRARRGDGVLPPTNRSFLVCGEDSFLIWSTYTDTTRLSAKGPVDISLVEVRDVRGGLLNRRVLVAKTIDETWRPLAIDKRDVVVRVRFPDRQFVVGLLSNQFSTDAETSTTKRFVKSSEPGAIEEQWNRR